MVCASGPTGQRLGATVANIKGRPRDGFESQGHGNNASRGSGDPKSNNAIEIRALIKSKAAAVGAGRGGPAVTVLDLNQRRLT
jgi:hypothetical protein